MTGLTIDNLEDSLEQRLRQRARTHGRSPEEEARAILRAALQSGEKPDGANETLGALVADLFGPQHGVDLEDYLPERETMRSIPGLVIV